MDWIKTITLSLVVSSPFNNDKKERSFLFKLANYSKVIQFHITHIGNHTHK